MTSWNIKGDSVGFEDYVALTPSLAGIPSASVRTSSEGSRGVSANQRSIVR